MTDTEGIKLTMILQANNINWRGVATPDLECEAQLLQTQIADWRACPWVLEARASNGFDPAEYRERWIFWLQANVDSIQHELQRRQQLSFSGGTPRPTAIAAMKAKLGWRGLIDVLGEYTQVLCEGGRYQFRCGLHGDGYDAHPSGTIDKNTARWRCWACNKGGDVLDALVVYGKMPISDAITWLARYTGLDPDPFPKTTGQKLPTVGLGEIQ
jgi:hypothetical protein